MECGDGKEFDLEYSGKSVRGDRDWRCDLTKLFNFEQHTGVMGCARCDFESVEPVDIKGDLKYFETACAMAFALLIGVHANQAGQCLAFECQDIRVEIVTKIKYIT